MTKQNKGRKLFAVSASAALVASAIVPVASAAAFTDESKIAPWAKEFVDFVVENEIMTGNADGSFNPKGNFTRAEAATVIANYLQLDTENTESSFADVSEDAWYYGAINAVAAEGLVDGVGNGNFNPKAPLTRQDAAKLFGEVFGLDTEEADLSVLDQFNDADKIKDYAAGYVALFVEAGVINGKGEGFDPAGLITREELAKIVAAAIQKLGGDVEPPIDEAEAKIVSATATNKTTVVVELSKEVDAVTSENFTIEGARVDTAALAEDKKTVTLDVSGLNYDSAYTVVTTGIKVNDEVEDFGSAQFTTPEVAALWDLEVSPKAAQLVADGADNTVVEFNLVGADGQIDKNADNIVLEINTTFGNLANTRVTIKDGVGQVVLSSEYSAVGVQAKISAKIIEASEDYKELIGEVAGEAVVNFVASGAQLDPNLVTFLDAESNQADRVVLYFDKPVDVSTFVKVDEKTGKFVTEKRADGISKQVFKDGVTLTISQNGDTKEVLGLKNVAGNAKAVEVILAKTKEANTTKTNVLTDNKEVTVETQFVTTNNKKEFTLTDARQPEVTSVTPDNLRTLTLKFSESVATGNYIIDGQLELNKDFTVEYGEYDASTALDSRDTAKIKLGLYKAGRPGTITTGDDKNIDEQRYFNAGSHSITVHQLQDFAGLTDPANVSTSQLLSFNINADETAPNAVVTVESPEQFRITFDKELGGNPIATIQNALANGAFQILNTKTGKYDEVKVGDVFAVKPEFVVTQPDADKAEYVVELTKDWTNILKGEKDTYANYKFQIAFEEAAFTNASNGVKSSKIELNLNDTGSALNTVDNTSPEIKAIVETSDLSVYEVQMTEPVKLPGLETSGVGNTEGKFQGALPKVQVEFQGKDKDGKIVVVEGEVVQYSAKNGDDTKFLVKTKNTSLTQLVKDGHSTNWTVVVKSISDDVGNTTATDTEDFVVDYKAADTKFYILSHENKAIDANIKNEVIAWDNTSGTDKVEIVFSKAVAHTGGINDVTNPANWTLNGKALENVKSITVADVNPTAKDGNEKVIIEFNDANVLKASSNVIAINRNILSADGTVLTGEFEVVAQTIINGKVPTQDELDAAAVTSLIAALPEVADLKESDAEAVAAVNAAYTELTPTAKALVSNKAKLDAAIAKIAELTGNEIEINITTATASPNVALPILRDYDIAGTVAVEGAASVAITLTTASGTVSSPITATFDAATGTFSYKGTTGAAVSGTVTVFDSAGAELKSQTFTISAK